MPNALLEAIGPIQPPGGSPVAPWLASQRIYHAAPLHYLPSIIESGQLISAKKGRALGIAPRSSALRRDRMLGVDEYVHLAFDLLTPLLCHKLRQGMPHVVFAFDAARVYAAQPGSCALLPCNTKAFRSRAACAPEHGEREMSALLKARQEFGRRPSLEFLVSSSLPLDALMEITLFSDRDAAIVRSLLHALRPKSAALLVQRHAPEYVQTAITETQNYCHACVAAKRALQPPPKIEFD